MAENNGTPKVPGIELPQDMDADYANLARITHSPSEFIFDFAQMLPGLKAPQFKSRILLSPLSAKLIYKALGENLAKYEASYGEITVPGSSSLADNLFKPTKDS